MTRWLHWVSWLGYTSYWRPSAFLVRMVTIAPLQKTWLVVLPFIRRSRSLIPLLAMLVSQFINVNSKINHTINSLVQRHRTVLQFARQLHKYLPYFSVCILVLWTRLTLSWNEFCIIVMQCKRSCASLAHSSIGRYSVT